MLFAEDGKETIIPETFQFTNYVANFVNMNA